MDTPRKTNLLQRRGLPQRIVTRALQRYWRMSRGLTMGAQAMVLDAEDRVLLVRLGYKPGWHMPGGGVERNETVREAMRRELEEEGGVVLTREPPLFGLYANFRSFPSDHVAFFVVRDWQRPRVPEPNREIVESKFFPATAIPPDAVGAVGRRLNEVLHGAPISDDW